MLYNPKYNLVLLDCLLCQISWTMDVINVFIFTVKHLNIIRSWHICNYHEIINYCCFLYDLKTTCISFRFARV